MSEKIVQLNEEIIKGQIEVTTAACKMLNELLEKEAESLTQAARYKHSEARGYRSGHYNRIPPPPPVTLRSTCPGSRACPSRRPSSNDIAAGRAAWRRPSSRCTWRASPCAGWRANQRRHCRGGKVSPATIQRAEQESLRSHRGLAQPPLARVARLSITSTWTASTCAATGAESTRMWPFWWQSP